MGHWIVVAGVTYILPIVILLWTGDSQPKNLGKASIILLQDSEKYSANEKDWVVPIYPEDLK